LEENKRKKKVGNYKTKGRKRSLEQKEGDLITRRRRERGKESFEFEVGRKAVKKPVEDREGRNIVNNFIITNQQQQT